MERKFLPVSIALLTVSDTRVIENDKSGNLLVNKIKQSGHILFDRKIVKDEVLDIQKASKKWIKNSNVEVIISTGGGTIEDVDRVIEATSEYKDNIVLLQCTAGYPVAWKDLNLNVIKTYRERYPDNVIGLSSHDSGIAMALVAYILGARVIEKHFTLNRANKGTDKTASK